MTRSELDDVDRGILHVLQEDARNNSAGDIADEVGVAANTVRNRIERLEDEGILRGYHPDIDYEKAGFQLHVNFVSTVPASDTAEMAEKALDIHGVIRVVQRLSGHRNLAIEAVGKERDDIATIASRLEEIGCNIEDEWFIKEEQMHPFNHFGITETTES